jgi:probable HAF family extracellular repeat protein
MNAIPKWLTALALITWSGCALAQAYSITDLGTINGSPTPVALGMNASGEVVGASSPSGLPGTRAFFYSSGVMHDLGTLGGTSSMAWGVNASGQVTGWLTTATGVFHAFITAPNGGVMTDLGTAPGALNSLGFSINNSGQVVGYGNGYPPTGTSRGFISGPDGGPLSNIALLPGTYSGVATGINANGEVTGYDYDANGIAYAYIRAPNGGALNDLGTVNGLPTYASSINANGVITGVAYIDNTTEQVPFTAFIGSANGGPLTVISSNMYGASINDRGDVVGWTPPAAAPPPANTTRALLYTKNSGVIDLNGLIIGPLAPFVTLTDARAINDNGWIAANGTDSRESGTGKTHAYLLTAVALLPLTLACPAATAQVGASYHSALTAAGGIPPYTFSNTGNLPGGLTLNASTGAITGTPTTSGPFNFKAQVVDSSGLAADTVTSNCTITVSPAPNFSISALPASVSIVQGSTGTSAISTKALYGFASSVKLRQSGAPTGTSVTFMPTSVSAGNTSTMQITVGSSTAVGTYPLTVTGTSGALSQTTTVSLTVTPAPSKSGGGELDWLSIFVLIGIWIPRFFTCFYWRRG